MSKLFITAVSILVLLQDCSKDELILNGEYVTVSDLYYYCTCRCRGGKTFSCEDKEVKVKGHFQQTLKDIRNGYEIEVYFNFPPYLDTNTHTQAILDKISSSNRANMCYIKGIVKPAQINAGLSCKLVPIIILKTEDDIYFAE